MRRVRSENSLRPAARPSMKSTKLPSRLRACLAVTLRSANVAASSTILWRNWRPRWASGSWQCCYCQDYMAPENTRWCVPALCMTHLGSHEPLISHWAKWTRWIVFLESLVHVSAPVSEHRIFLALAAVPVVIRSAGCGDATCGNGWWSY